MLAGNPVASAGNQVEVVAGIVAENLLNRRIQWRVEAYLSDVKCRCFAGCVNYHYSIANMHIAQIPEDSRTSSCTIKVSVDDRASTFTGARTGCVPSYVIPGMLFWHSQITIGCYSHIFYKSVDAYRGNEQTHRIGGSLRRWRVCCKWLARHNRR